MIDDAKGITLPNTSESDGNATIIADFWCRHRPDSDGRDVNPLHFLSYNQMMFALDRTAKKVPVTIVVREALVWDEIITPSGREISRVFRSIDPQEAVDLMSKKHIRERANRRVQSAIPSKVVDA